MSHKAQFTSLCSIYIYLDSSLLGVYKIMYLLNSDSHHKRWSSTETWIIAPLNLTIKQTRDTFFLHLQIAFLRKPNMLHTSYRNINNFEVCFEQAGRCCLLCDVNVYMWCNLFYVLSLSVSMVIHIYHKVSSPFEHFPSLLSISCRLNLI